MFTQVVQVPDAEWLRLQFAELKLAGDPADETGSTLRLTSLKDGAVQELNAETAEQWGNTSAYFNGNAVKVELIASTGTGDNRVRIVEATAGEPPIEERSICGGTDNRTLSNDPRSGRHMPEGCSAWLHDDLNRTFMTAGHCGVSANDVVQFNVPLSNANGSLNHPPPSDQYVVEPTSIQSQNGGAGNDWAYFATQLNTETGLSAFQVQGQTYVKAATAPAVSGQTIRITGYGTVSSPVSQTWRQVQKTHTGPYSLLGGPTGTLIRYQVDTTGGNSGSAVQNETAGTVIGIHTHAGCTSSGGSNQGTAIHHANLQNALNNPLGLCRSGRNTVSPPIYAAGDLNNNFGTANATSGAFGKIGEVASNVQGLAYNRNASVFYGTTSAGNLVSINPANGSATLIAAISGTSQVINGLGYDPNANVLYGIAQSSGQLFRINTSTGAATAVGAAWGGTTGALDYDPVSNTLYGINDSSGTSKLIRINTTDGTQVFVGNLGAGIGDCNGLAFNPADGQLYTINAANEQTLRINPATGVATAVGPSGGLFGASYGMAATQAATGGTVNPHLFSLFLGRLISGGLPELTQSDDSRLRVMQTPERARGMPGVQLLLTGTSPLASSSEIKFKLETGASVNTLNLLTQRLELFDFALNDWVIVNSRLATTEDTTIEVSITNNPTRFIEPGTRLVRARISWFDADILNATRWIVHIDQAVWTVQP